MKSLQVLTPNLSVLLVVMTGSSLLLPTPARAQGGVPLWTNVYYGPITNAGDEPRAIAVDSSGNVFVTGNSFGDGTFRDYATIKYSADGVPLWTNRYDRRLEYAAAIAVDTNGDVIVTGSSSPPFCCPRFDYATLKYSRAGDLLWENYYDGGFDDYGGGVAVDGDGNVVVSGVSLNATIGGLDEVTIKYSSIGDMLWINRYGPGTGSWQDGQPSPIAVDSSGSVAVAARSQMGGNVDFATIKYSADGVPLWTNLYNGPGNSLDLALAIAIDRNDNVIVTGFSPGVGGASGGATIKYSGSGVPLWTNRYNGVSSGIVVDMSGNVFVSGGVKYSAAGVPLWTNFLAGSAIAVDSSDNVFVTGSLGNNPAVIAFSNAGVPLWTNYLGCCSGSKIVLDKSGDVLVLGSASNGTKSGFQTIKYSPTVPPPRLDFQKLNNELVLSWTNAGFHLQSAPAVTGPFTNLPAATSPYTNFLTAPRQFFRLIGN